MQIIECPRCGATVERVELGGNKYQMNYEGNFHLHCQHYVEKLAAEKTMKIDVPQCPDMNRAVDAAT